MDSGEVLGLNRSDRTWQCGEAVESPEKQIRYLSQEEVWEEEQDGVRREGDEFCEGQEGVSRTELDILVGTLRG